METKRKKTGVQFQKPFANEKRIILKGFRHINSLDFVSPIKHVELV